MARNFYIIASEASFLVYSMARIFYIIIIESVDSIIESVDSIIESVDSISMDERDVPLTQYSLNISC